MRGADDSGTSKLLAGARSLQSLIQDSTDLPTVSRSIHQIASQSESMLRAASATSTTPAEPSAATYRFLAAHGVDAMALDPSALELTRGAGASGLDASSGALGADLEAFLAHEQRQILHEAVLEANQLVIDDFEASFWTHDRTQWDALKPRLLESFHFEAGRYETTATPQTPAGPAMSQPAQQALATPGPQASGRSRVRSARSVEYAKALAPLWDQRSGIGTDRPFDLMTKWGEVACGGRVAVLEGSSTKLTNCWKLLQAMATSAKRVTVSDPKPASLAVCSARPLVHPPPLWRHRPRKCLCPRLTRPFPPRLPPSPPGERGRGGGTVA